MPTPRGRAAVEKAFVSPDDSSNPSGQFVLSGAPVATQNGLWATCSYAYNPVVFRPAPVGLGRSFPDGTSHTLLFTEKYQVSGEGSSARPNFWFGSHVGENNVGARAAVIPGAELWVTPTRYSGGNFLAANLGAAPGRANLYAPTGPHAGGILIGSADGSVRFLSAAGATARLGPAPLPGLLAAYDETVPWPVVMQRGYVWTALLTPAGGEVVSAD